MKTEKFVKDIEKIGFIAIWVDDDVFIETINKGEHAEDFVARVSTKYPYSFSLTDYKFYAIPDSFRKELFNLIIRYTKNPNNRWSYDRIKEWRESYMNNTNFTNYDRWKTTPPEQPSELVAYDWLSRPIFSDDNDEFILIDGEYVLDEPDEIRAYLLENGVIKNTMDIYEEALENG